MNNRTITAREGYKFATADKARVVGSVIALAIHDSAKNYVEVTLAEAEEISRREAEKEEE